MRHNATIAIICAAGLLSGCFEVSADGKFQSDGTVKATIEFGISAQLLALAQSGNNGGTDPLGSCGNLQRLENPPKGMKLLDSSRGVKGDMMTCTMVVEIADPVASAKEFKREAKPDDPLIMDNFALTRIGDGTYRFQLSIEANPKVVEAKAGKPNDSAGAMGKALAATMMANHFVTLSLSAEHIENTTGELSSDGHTVTWRLPIILLVSPVAGFRQDIKADLIYHDSYFNKALRLLGLN
jgi:hypothetical protein